MKPDSTEYRGLRERDGSLFVSVDGKALHHVIRHSPTGMEAGYGGSGPADTALSILTDFLGHDRWTLLPYQAFKWAFLAQPNTANGFVITGKDIRSWLEATQREAEAT